MKLIVGLGNPGKNYERTRHNVGFFVVDALLSHDRNKLKKGKGPFQANAVPFQGGEAVIAKPTLFMNESGRAVHAMLDEFHILPQDCLVVTDDVNLPVGRIRFRSQGSAGGHHGLESIIGILGTENFARLRVGVGSGDLSGRDITDYVLGDFSSGEWKLLLPQIERARDGCLEWIKSDMTSVMQRYNN